MKKIRENRCTCSACGHIWHYGKAEEVQAKGAALQEAGKAMMCCSGCAPAAFLPNRQVVDLGKCPQCGSRAIEKTVIEHEVP